MIRGTPPASPIPFEICDSNSILNQPECRIAMLDATLNSSFAPGTNRKGDVTGANWLYLLPMRDMGQIVVVGLPTYATLRALAERAQRVRVFCTSDRELQRARRLLSLFNTTGKQARVDALRITRNEPFGDVTPQSADLIVFVHRPTARRLVNNLEFQNQCRGLLAPSGAIYVEFRGLGRFVRGAAANLAQTFGGATVLWLTPLAGEMHTAVPLADVTTISCFLQRKLDSRSISVHSLLKRSASTGAEMRPNENHRINRRRGLKHLVRAAGRKLVDFASSAEGRIQRAPALRNLCGRMGILIGQPAATLANRPPQYLCDIARAAGVGIETFRWGLAAGGEYSSRKLLFFLLEGSNSTPKYVVKMTRDPRFNARLERESQALAELHENHVLDGMLPQVVFAGTHGGLAIVGETFVDGVPFNDRSHFEAGCPYAHAAVEWLTQLGETTADPYASNPQSIAAVLEQLRKRFVEIYKPSEEEQNFLARQIRMIAASDAPIPLVFQHGDAGRWNVLTTSDERVRFLDWEAAESQGLPLWDLFYFLRSFSIGAGTRDDQAADRTETFASQVLEETDVARLFIDAVARYASRLGLSGSLVGPLFHTCWMHRALKEATRLPPSELRNGSYYRLFRLCMDRRNVPTMKRLFLPAESHDFVGAETAPGS